MFTGISSVWRPRFERNVRAAFDPQRYWQDRHEAHRGSLKAVGHRLLDEAANAVHYERKAVMISEMIRRHVPSPRGKTLLDAGCGIGMLIPIYEQLGFHVTGVDFSETAIEQAQARCPSASYHVLPLADVHLDARFDVVTVIDVLLHIVEERLWRHTLATLAGHLSPDGLMVILDTFADGTGRWSRHVAPRSQRAFVGVLGELQLHIVERIRFDQPPEPAVKDLLAIRFSNGPLPSIG